MADSDVLIQIRGDVADINAKLADVKGNIGKVTEETKKMADQSQNYLTQLKSNWVAATASIMGTIAAMRGAWNLAEGAAKFEEMETGLQGLAAQYGMTADSAIKMAKEAVNGQLSMADAGKLAAKSFALGFNPQQVTDFLTEAERLSHVLGGTIPEAFDAMERAAATGRKGALVSIGINVDLKKTINDYAEANGIAKDSISAHTATLLRANAIMEAAKKVTDQMGEAHESTAVKINRMKATLADIELLLGQGVIRAAAGATAGFQYLAAGVLGLVSAYAQYRAMVYKVIGDGEQETENTEIANAAMGARNEILKDAAKNWELATSSRVVLGGIMKKTQDEETENLKKNKDIENALLKEATTQNKKVYEQAVEEADHAAKMQASAGEDELDYFFDIINRKKAALNKWYDSQSDAINQYVDNEEVAKAKLTTLWDDYNKQWQKYADQQEEKTSSLVNASVSKYVALETTVEKTWENITKKREAAYEAEINSQLKGLDVAEKEGTYHRDTLTERISLLERLKTIQEAYLATIDKQKDTSAWYAQIEAINKTKSTLQEVQSAYKPVTAALHKYAEEATDVYTQLGTLSTSVMKGLEDQLVNFCTKGKMNFQEFANSIIANIVRIYIKSQITGPMESWFSDLGSYLNSLAGGSSSSAAAGGTGAAVSSQSGVFTSNAGGLFSEMAFHKGGMANEPSFYRLVPSFAFANAPRYHGGFASDERPAILKKGEGVFTPGQMKALGLLVNGGTKQDSGGSGGNVNIIYAMDTKSFEEYCKRNASTLLNTVSQGIKDNQGIRNTIRKYAR